jgi:hypothetical protein
MMFGTKSQGNQRRQKFFLANQKYGLPKLEKKFKKGKGDCASVVLCRIRMLVYFDTSGNPCLQGTDGFR